MATATRKKKTTQAAITKADLDNLGKEKTGKQDPREMGFWGYLGGRPVAYEKPEDMLEKFYVYIDRCEEKKRIPSKVGLALALGIATDTLLEYKKKEGFSATVKFMLQTIEDEWLQRLPKAQSQGAVFYLKAAFKYREDDRAPDGLTVNFLLTPEIAAKYLPVANVVPVEANVIHETPPSTGANSEGQA